MLSMRFDLLLWNDKYLLDLVRYDWIEEEEELAYIHTCIHTMKRPVSAEGGVRITLISSNHPVNHWWCDSLSSHHTVFVSKPWLNIDIKWLNSIVRTPVDWSVVRASLKENHHTRLQENQNQNKFYQHNTLQCNLIDEPFSTDRYVLNTASTRGSIVASRMNHNVVMRIEASMLSTVSISI